MASKNPNESSSFLQKDLKVKSSTPIVEEKTEAVKSEIEPTPIITESTTSEIKSTEPVKPVEPPKPEVIIQEKRVVEYRDRKGGLFGTGIGCSTIGCIFFLLLLVCCVSVILIIISRPPNLWNPVVTHLNAGLELPEYQAASANYVEENIISNLKPGQNDIYITEDQLTTIAREKLTQFKDLRFDIENGELSMYWALDNSENPVYAQVKMKAEDNNIKFVKVGTPNLTLPEATNDILNSLTSSLLNLADKNSEGSIINTFLTEDANFELNLLEFQKDKLHLDVNINVDLFQ